MKVYTIEEYIRYEGTLLKGVTSSRELAIQFIEKLKLEPLAYADKYLIEEFELDDL